ncbi:hypothetical protein PLICRDRAFT_173773 [Plicaturopsis crispa FD-325 SS-3]|nr:hypothetical protein PLICRDRAFT_173773 [Plicaturopsis crispa FD-325 SS-3]
MDSGAPTPNVDTNAAASGSSSRNHTELVGCPFAVLESDPGVFTSLTRKLGIRGLEVVEVYGIDPHEIDHLGPRGLIFCFLWRKDNHRPTDFEDPAAERVWFANQLIDDACASLAILNIALNCPEVDIGDELKLFRADTERMTPEMKGLAISNLALIREAHNSLARPADRRGTLNAISDVTMNAKNKKPKNPPKSPSSKRSKAIEKSRKAKADAEPETTEEAYHFIGYVPAYGKVWELDGLKSGPLEVGELPDPASTSINGWMDIARPALKMKMQKYGSDETGNIKFSLLALVADRYQAVSDDLEMLKRVKTSLERRMTEVFPEGWAQKVDPVLLASSTEVFTTLAQPAENGRPFAPDFGLRKQTKELEILKMAACDLPSAWEGCINSAMSAKVLVEEEIAKSTQANTDHIKRTHDYEPFITHAVECIHREGLLNPLLGVDEDGKKLRKKTKPSL